MAALSHRLTYSHSSYSALQEINYYPEQAINIYLKVLILYQIKLSLFALFYYQLYRSSSIVAESNKEHAYLTHSHASFHWIFTCFFFGYVYYEKELETVGLTSGAVPFKTHNDFLIATRVMNGNQSPSHITIPLSRRQSAKLEIYIYIFLYKMCTRLHYYA